MPIYAYECLKHGRFEIRQPMFDERKADCSKCDKPAEPRISLCDYRFAEPITILQDLGGNRGYQVLGWKADSGISPKQGQPYKTGREVAHEEEDSRNAKARQEKEEGKKYASV
ncbi:hypothetical protein LCGC14_0839840 [marine sediment metagenome]|uniref:Putative regulatory protein FmdB zinc ribbon domain-containing protein n=1 Tax=marine sediment metagenome TaxID=412755 RepID=A0A0F9PDI4_9ZZZZ